jgi:transcriptional regulator with XRE-family HTH domain
MEKRERDAPGRAETPAEFKSLVASRLKARREACRLTQRELAAAIGMTRTAYSQYETGANDIRAYDLALAAKALECTIGYLVGETPLRVVEDAELAELFGALPAETRKSAIAAMRAFGEGVKTASEF